MVTVWSAESHFRCRPAVSQSTYRWFGTTAGPTGFDAGAIGFVMGAMGFDIAAIGFLIGATGFDIAPTGFVIGGIGLFTATAGERQLLMVVVEKVNRTPPG